MNLSYVIELYCFYFIILIRYSIFCNINDFTNFDAALSMVNTYILIFLVRALTFFRINVF